jgi:hypothetical protein
VTKAISTESKPLAEVDRQRREPATFEKNNALVLAPDAFLRGQRIVIDRAHQPNLRFERCEFGGRRSQDLWKQAAPSALIGLDPKTEIEGILATQLIACHMSALDCFRRAMIKNQNPQFRDYNLNQANKLCRTYTTLLEALRRCQDKASHQKVTVEHVHVHEGGQAIVGHVEHKEGGSGTNIGGSTPCS